MNDKRDKTEFSIELTPALEWIPKTTAHERRLSVPTRQQETHENTRNDEKE